MHAYDYYIDVTFHGHGGIEVMYLRTAFQMECQFEVMNDQSLVEGYALYHRNKIWFRTNASTGKQRYKRILQLAYKYTYCCKNYIWTTLQLLRTHLIGMGSPYIYDQLAVQVEHTPSKMSHLYQLTRIFQSFMITYTEHNITGTCTYKLKVTHYCLQ
jgi:hypothetical protein